MKRIALGLALFIACSAGIAQTAAPTKKELVAKVLQLTQPGIEQLARNVAEQPAAQLMQRAGAALATRVPADKREAVAEQIRADVKAYVEETTPLLRERAVKLLPETFGSALEEKFSEEELKGLIAWHESPLNRKYQEFAPQMHREFLQKLVTDSRATIEPKLRALDAALAKRLGLPPRPAAAASAAAPASSGPAKKK